jgi:TonB family protein
MEIVTNYIIESAIGLGILTVIYRLILRQKANLAFNRFYLLFSILFSAVLPLISIDYKSSSESILLPEFIVGNQGILLLDSVAVYATGMNQKITTVLQEVSWMKFIYLTGIFILLCRTLFGLYRLRLFKRKAVLEKFPMYTLVNSNSNVEPFSFFNFVFINKALYNDKEFQAIINHELAHIQLKHSMDNLLLEIMFVIQWFNPFIWLLRLDLKEIQEFQADRNTIEKGINPLFYKELLLGQALGTRFALGNSFNQLLIKKRLKMINSKINNSIGFVRISALSLIVCMVLIVFACEQKSTGEQEVYTQVEIMPEYPGGFDGVRKFLAENIKYPAAAEEMGISGRVFVSFVVSETGEVTNAKVERGVDPELDAEALRVINQLPNWKPGVEKGKKVPVKFTMPIVFSLNTNEETYVIVEEMPKFKGGEKGMMDFIRKNVLYPKEAREKNIEGKALVNFTVDKSGKVKSVKIRRSSGNEFLDKEAIRVVQSMPDWEPALQGGQKVEVKFTIPLDFIMTNKGGAIVVKESELLGEKIDVHVDFEKVDDKIIATGCAKDQSGTPLEGTSVVIKGTANGTVTGHDGNFSIILGSDTQELVFSYVGKETVVVRQ